MKPQERRRGNWVLFDIEVKHEAANVDRISSDLCKVNTTLPTYVCESVVRIHFRGCLAQNRWLNSVFRKITTSNRSCAALAEWLVHLSNRTEVRVQFPAEQGLFSPPSAAPGSTQLHKYGPPDYFH